MFWRLFIVYFEDLLNQVAYCLILFILKIVYCLFSRLFIVYFEDLLNQVAYCLFWRLFIVYSEDCLLFILKLVYWLFWRLFIVYFEDCLLFILKICSTRLCQSEKESRDQLFLGKGENSNNWIFFKFLKHWVSMLVLHIGERAREE